MISAVNKWAPVRTNDAAAHEQCYRTCTVFLLENCKTWLPLGGDKMKGYWKFLPRLVISDGHTTIVFSCTWSSQTQRSHCGHAHRYLGYKWVKRQFLWFGLQSNAKLQWDSWDVNRWYEESLNSWKSESGLGFPQKCQRRNDAGSYRGDSNLLCSYFQACEIWLLQWT